MIAEMTRLLRMGLGLEMSVIANQGYACGLEAAGAPSADYAVCRDASWATHQGCIAIVFPAEAIHTSEFFRLFVEGKWVVRLHGRP